MDPLEPFVKALQEEPWDDIPKDKEESGGTWRNMEEKETPQNESQTLEFQPIPEPESFQNWGDPSAT